jgi:hypothetical protein
LIVATERITDAEASAERERKLAVKDNHAQGRYDPGSIYREMMANCRIRVYFMHCALFVDVRSCLISE